MESFNHTTRQYASGSYCPVVAVHSIREGRYFVTLTQHGEKDARTVVSADNPRVFDRGEYSSFNGFVWWKE